MIVSCTFLSEIIFRCFKSMFVYFSVNASYFLSLLLCCQLTLLVMLLVVNTLPLYCCDPASVLLYLINHLV